MTSLIYLAPVLGIVALLFAFVLAGKVNAMDEALKLGNSKVFNIIVLGVAAKHMDFSKEDWLSVIEKTVPAKTVEINKKAFLLGYES